MKISYAMHRVLKDVERGRLDCLGGGPFQVGNTNSTAAALKTRGLICLADDQSEASRSLRFAWVLTDSGRAALTASNI
jgi:hypothetical protein